MIWLIYLYGVPYLFTHCSNISEKKKWENLIQFFYSFMYSYIIILLLLPNDQIKKKKNNKMNIQFHLL